MSDLTSRTKNGRLSVMEQTKTGWVIRDETTYTNGRLAGKRMVSWWYGPTHGWGTTYGSQPMEGKVFPTKVRAEEAYANVYGRGWRTRRASTTVRAQRLTEALAEYEARNATHV